MSTPDEQAQSTGTDIYVLRRGATNLVLALACAAIAAIAGITAIYSGEFLMQAVLGLPAVLLAVVSAALIVDMVARWREVALAVGPDGVYLAGEPPERIAWPEVAEIVTYQEVQHTMPLTTAIVSVATDHVVVIPTSPDPELRPPEPLRRDLAAWGPYRSFNEAVGLDRDRLAAVALRYAPDVRVTDLGRRGS